MQTRYLLSLHEVDDQLRSTIPSNGEDSEKMEEVLTVLSSMHSNKTAELLKAMGPVETHGLSNKSAKCRRVAESVGSHRGYTTFDSNAIQKYSEPFQNNRSFDPQYSQILLLQVKESYHIFFTVIQSISVSDNTLADLDGLGLDFSILMLPEFGLNSSKFEDRY